MNIQSIITVTKEMMNIDEFLGTEFHTQRSNLTIVSKGETVGVKVIEIADGVADQAEISWEQPFTLYTEGGYVEKCGPVSLVATSTTMAANLIISVLNTKTKK